MVRCPAIVKRGLAIPNSELTQSMISQSRVIAKGNRIRDVHRLVDTYGGRPSRWVKKSSPAFEVDGLQCEYHWYEHPGIDRVELKQVNRI